MELTAGAWTEIFRAGDYGAKGTYGADDLDKMVANFNTSDQVPIVVGHPETDSPAWGWLAAVKRAGDVLMGKVGELHKDFAQALAEHKFRNRSVRIARTATGPKLLHLGFLGATLPQVEGLKQTAQFAGVGDRVDYGFDLPGQADNPDNPKEKTKMTEEEIAKMQADLKKSQEDLAAEKAGRLTDKEAADKKADEAKGAEFSAWVETEMVATGKLPAGRKDEVTAFMRSLPDGDAADFSFAADGATKSVQPVAWFKDFVKGLAAAEFTRELPVGTVKDFSRKKESGKLVDLSHKV
jgi:hypothetical protein